MTDERFRELERRWRETGSVEDEAAWLRERSRTGTLSLGTLAIAAYLGHDPARLVLGSEAPGRPGDVEPWNHWLPEWCTRLVQLPAWTAHTGAYARAALAAFAASPAFVEQRRQWREQRPGDSRPERAITSLEAFALCPCERDDQQRRDGARLAEAARKDPDSRIGTVDFFNGYLLAVWDATNQEYLYDLLFDLADPTAEGHRHRAGAVSSELVPWLLGVADPVLAQVRMREASL